MRMTDKFWKAAAMSLGALALALTTQAQVNTNPVPNLTVSWDFDVWGFTQAAGYNGGLPVPNTSAGLALATNWNDGWNENGSSTAPWGTPPLVTNLWDITGAASGMDLRYNGFNGASVVAAHKGMDADGSYNREMINGYLNTGAAGWNPPITNSFVSISNISYPVYDVVVYFNSDNAGRRGSIDNGATTYYFSTVGGPSVSGVNALLLPTTETNSAVFPPANFAFFPGMTGAIATFTEKPKSGNDQWLGICGFQLVQASNTYVLYGAYPAAQIVPVGQPATFKVMAGGLNPGYQWRLNGADIPNATNATYTIAATAVGQDGGYDVVVANSFSSTTSCVASLTFYSPKTIEWAGNNSVWDTATTDWTANGGVATIAYTDTDNVLLSPLGIAQSTITLSGTRTPGSITVSNSTYTLVSGTLAGTSALHLKNNATLILDTVDTRTGPTIIDSGSTFQLDNGDTAGGMGAGALTNNGALVFNAAGDEGYAYPVYGMGNITNMGPSGLITLGSSVSANYLVQAGGGNLLLQGNNSLTGGMIISGGAVLARSPGALGGAPVAITGGELQLIFGFVYVGSPLTLAGGTLHGGVMGSQVFQGTVTLGADSTVQVDTGNNLTLSNAAGFNGGGFNLTKTGNGTLILPAANNSWASVGILVGTLQIGNGGATGSLGAGNIQDDGALTFDLSGNLTVTNTFSGAGAINQIGSGTATLTADNAANGFGGTINVTNGTLLINGTSGSGAVTVAGGSLGGSGTIGGPVTVLPGGTIAPGTSIGTLTLGSDLTLAGNLSVEVNKSLTQSNDVVGVGGALANAGTGIVTVNNLGPALAVGDTFALFSQPVTGGETMTVSGAGVIWTNKLAVDGTIQVVSTSIPRAVITHIAMPDSASLVFSGTNGYPGSTYTVLASTNVSLPLTSWTVEANGSFDGSGAFSVTNTVMTGVPQKFYLLRQ